MICLATCKFKVANSETSNSSIIRAMEEPQRIFHNLFATTKELKGEKLNAPLGTRELLTI